MPASNRPIRGGDLLHLTRAASVQFHQPITVRVIREMTDRHTYDGWTWLEVYELRPDGTAVAKRELFVQRSGVYWLNPAPTAPPGTARHTLRPTRATA